MTQSPILSAQPPGETLERLADTRATGVLQSAGGAVYLLDGAVVHAESDQSVGVVPLLAGCGRIPLEAWHESVRAYGPEHRVARMLVAQKLVSQGELELCHLVALYDAAFFALTAWCTATSFVPGVAHWLGPLGSVNARRLRREAVRRRDLLERAWPCPQVDAAPVVPIVSGLPARRALGRRQHELLDHADGRRTPADLARLLGRSAFETLLEVRRLAAGGLVATPPDTPGASVGPPRTASGLHRRTPGAQLPVPGPPPPPGPPTSPGAPPALPRRRSAAAHPPSADHSATDPDIALLTRVRTLLEARL